MKATRLDITNFRGIKDLSIELDPRINVFIGKNGTGKTAILDAISTILSPYRVRDMNGSDVTNGKSFSSIKLVNETKRDGIVEREFRVSIDGEEGIDYDGEIIVVYDFTEFLEWFYNMNHTYGCEDNVKIVVYALKEFLPAFSDFYVAKDPIRLIAIKDGEMLEMRQLSAGEMSIIDIVGVLAMRMVINYPKPGNTLAGSEVVIIDEIDAHLHPMWQRMIVPKLLEIFPYCQFIISTNSPHIVNHVRPESVFILESTDDGGVVRKPNDSYGKNVDRVLEDLMDMETTRPDKVAHDLHHIFEMIDDGYLDTAKEHIVNMISEIGDDPDLGKARVLIRRMEFIGK